MPPPGLQSSPEAKPGQQRQASRCACCEPWLVALCGWVPWAWQPFEKPHLCVAAQPTLVDNCVNKQYLVGVLGCPARGRRLAQLARLEEAHARKGAAQHILHVTADGVWPCREDKAHVVWQLRRKVLDDQAQDQACMVGKGGEKRGKVGETVGQLRCKVLDDQAQDQVAAGLNGGKRQGEKGKIGETVGQLRSEVCKWGKGGGKGGKGKGKEGKAGKGEVGAEEVRQGQFAPLPGVPREECKST
eukprot:364526-Chlamydomonas_euryale.AAC.2